MKTNLVSAKNLEIIELFWPSLSVSQVWPHFVLKRTCRCQQLLHPTQKLPLLCLAVRCAGALPREFRHWLSSQNLLLSSGIAFGSDFQMTSKGWNLNLNLNSASWLSWPTSCRCWKLRQEKRRRSPKWGKRNTSTAARDCTSTIRSMLAFHPGCKVHLPASAWQVLLQGSLAGWHEKSSVMVKVFFSINYEQ